MTVAGLETHWSAAGAGLVVAKTWNEIRPRAAEAAELRPRDEEIGAIRFATPEDTATLLCPDIWQRIRHAFDAHRDHTTAYLHHGALTNNASSAHPNRIKETETWSLTSMTQVSQDTV